MVARRARAAARGGIIIALQGNLGAGKTTFVQGFARGLGIKRRMMSPTFIIMRRFKIPRNKRFKNLYHIDAYRIKKIDSLEAIGLEEVLADPTAIVLIEWPEKIDKALLKKAIWITFEHGKREHERVISLIK